MTAALVKLVTHDEPIQEMDPDAYAWMRLRAASACLPSLAASARRMRS